ncbi:two-component system sensor histidine kinase NtrB [Hydrocarboniphaga effusa]|jgi:two-component system NtrC family sensor kinase|uniref:two-component system sensor histidine kinase NtrB n=1 Tax=Hydrocarboniphaga effusa TaxID=243629 RepID=UPI0035AFCE0D
MSAAADFCRHRAERRIELLDRLVEERNRDLAITQEQASAVQSYLLGLNNVLPGALIGASTSGLVTRANRGAQELLGYPATALSGMPLGRIWPAAADFIGRCLGSGAQVLRDEAEWITHDDRAIPVLVSAATQRDIEGRVLSLVFVALDISERRRLEIELRQAQKLESLGQLSAGVAHEINTPMQFIGDNLHYVCEAFEGLRPLLDALPEFESELPAQSAQRLRELSERADLEFLRKRLPKSIVSALDGVKRVSHIVEAMRAFSHPQTEKTAVDLNRGLMDTLTVAHNEYKYVADVRCELGELPPIVCNGGDMNQVFLNLIVNAAHAIATRQRGDDKRRGRIHVRSWRKHDTAVFAIADDGCGIPREIRHRVFDPFFTTKEVGKGTGQGLSISRSVVVDHHHGSLSFDSEEGHGTTFFIRLPLHHAPPTSTETPSVIS